MTNTCRPINTTIPAKSYAEAASSTPRPKHQATSTIVVKKEENKNPSEVVSEISELLTKSGSEANILKIAKNKKGDTLLKFKSSDDISAIADDIHEQLGYNARGRPLLQPKMTVTHIPAHVEVENDLRQQLINNNKWLEGPLENGGELEVLFHYKPKDLFSAVLKMTPDVRNAIQDNGSLVIGNRACPVKDRFHVQRCSKCYAFGHRSANCQVTHQICGYCSDEHQTKSCPNKNNSSKLRCSVCSSAGSSDKTNYHSTFDKDCPRYLLELKRLIRITNYGERPPSL